MQRAARAFSEPVEAAGDRENGRPLPLFPMSSRRDEQQPQPASLPEMTSAKIEPLIRHRIYQREVFRHKLRRLFFLWARQSGKSYTLASEALDLMMATPGALVTFISASIVLGSEILLKEAMIWTQFLSWYRQAAATAGLKFESNADGLDFDAIADLFEHSKLETKLWHDRTTCSRSRVIAPNPDTAVGWTAHIIGDEAGRWPNAQGLMLTAQMH